MKPKRDMLRIVKEAEGKIQIDLSGKASGRGAYICNNAECILKLKKQKLLNKTFSAPVSDEVYAGIEEEFFGKQR
jgi:hypothetical protein